MSWLFIFIWFSWLQLKKDCPLVKASLLLIPFAIVVWSVKFWWCPVSSFIYLNLGSTYEQTPRSQFLFNAYTNCETSTVKRFLLIFCESKKCLIMLNFFFDSILVFTFVFITQSHFSSQILFFPSLVVVFEVDAVKFSRVNFIKQALRKKY